MIESIPVNTRWRRDDGSHLTVQRQEDANVHVVNHLVGGGLGADTLHVDQFKAFMQVSLHRITAGDLTAEHVSRSKLEPGLHWAGAAPAEDGIDYLVEVDVWAADPAEAERIFRESLPEARVLRVSSVD